MDVDGNQSGWVGGGLIDGKVRASGAERRAGVVSDGSLLRRHLDVNWLARGNGGLMIPAVCVRANQCGGLEGFVQG